MVHGEDKAYKAVTNKDDRFRIHVPAGHYVLRASLSGWSFRKDALMSCEDPSENELEREVARMCSSRGPRRNNGSEVFEHAITQETPEKSFAESFGTL